MHTMKNIVLASGVLAVVLAGCGPKSPETEAQERAAAEASANATATVLAIPTLLAQATAVANANATATVEAQATATAQAQATQQAREVESRVQAAVAATQAAIPTATPVPPTATPEPPTPTAVPATSTPVVVYVPQTVPPVYVPVPVPAPSGLAPQYVIDAINDSNNAYSRAKWNLNTNEFYGHVVGKELDNGFEYVRGLIKNRTRVDSFLAYGTVTSWYSQSPTRVIATTNESWRFTNYDADRYTLKKNLGTRLYRNIYTIDYVSGLGWKVSLDDVPNPNGEPI
jgi:hypothetical protein